MTTELLSFRLSGAELEWLESQRLKRESLNLTAKRLLLGLMSTPVDTTVDTHVDTTVDTEQLKQELKQEIKDELVDYIEDRIQFCINTCNNIVNPEQSEVYTPVDTTVDTQVDTPKKKPLRTLTIPELRATAKSLDIPYKARDSKAKLIKLISERKSINPCHHEP